MRQKEREMQREREREKESKRAASLAAQRNERAEKEFRQWNRTKQLEARKQRRNLYRNNGDETFTDVTEEAGLLHFGLSIGA